MLQMAEIPQNTKFLLFGFGPRQTAQMALVINTFGMATTILGIISAATKNSIGLGVGNWFLLSIILFIWRLSFWLTAYFGAKEGYTK
jgi:hypothetical protein